MPAPRVSLVVPCFDEAEALVPFGALLPGWTVHEVLFVDDGSRDATRARLDALVAADPRVRVLTHASNRGVGAAVRTGLDAAQGDVIVVYDADRTYPPDDVGRLVAEVVAGADVATASPLAAGGTLSDVPARRRFLTRCAAGAYRLVLGRRARGISTFTCAFRAYGPRARAVCRPRSDGFPAAAEMLGRAVLAGLRVVEVPSTLRTRTEGQSKLRFVRAARGHLATLGRLLGLRVTGAGAPRRGDGPAG